MRALGFALAFSSLADQIAAAPYTHREANNFSAQLQRSFNSTPRSTTVTVYKSTITGSGSSSSSSSGSSRARSGGAGGFASANDSNSWGMPMRQPTRSWGSGYVAPPDPDGDKIAAARRRTWELPVPPVADRQTIARYYRSKGVSLSRAEQAAQTDLDDYRRIVESRAADAKWAAYDREQRRISTYLAGQKAGRAAWIVELAATRARARASGGDGTGAGADPALAAAWLALAGSTQMWRGTYIEYDPLARREAVFFAARAGVRHAIIAAWGEAAAAGESADYWRDQSVLAGDTAALTAVYKSADQDRTFGFARAVALFEHAYQVMPATASPRESAEKAGAARAQCAYFLGDFYARGDATLPADPARALAWARKTPAAPPGGWQELQIYNRAHALEQLEANILTVRAVEIELLAEWEALLTSPADSRARRALYPIYLGKNPAFPRSADPVKASALYPGGADDLKLIIDVGDWPAAAKFEALPFDRHPSLPFLLGRLWRERTDGKRDLARARAAFTQAISDSRSNDGNGEAAIGLSEILLELGEYSAAQATLEQTVRHRLALARWRVQLRLALGFYRGEFREVSEKEGDALMAVLAKETSTLPGHFRDQEEKFVREFEFQRIAAPLLMRFNRLEAVRLETALPTWDGPVDIVRHHRENLAASLPALRALALSGYAPATRLWAMLVLSNYAAPSPADAGLAKTFLFQSGIRGDAPAVVVLAQRLYLDAQEARLTPDATPARLREQFAEAAAWLEAAWKTGDEGSLRPLHTIYHENLGGLGSAEKAQALLRALALSGDKDAAAEIAESEVATINLAALPSTEKFARLEKLAGSGNSAAKRESALMMFRGEGTPKDGSEQSSEVLFLLEEAANAGDFTAALWRVKIEYLGLYNGAGNRDADTVMQDRFYAKEFLHNVAHNGSPLMKYRVGLLYLNDRNREPECFLEAEPAFLSRAHLLLEKARDEGVKAAAAPLAQVAAQLRQQSK